MLENSYHFLVMYMNRKFAFYLNKHHNWGSKRHQKECPYNIVYILFCRHLWYYSNHYQIILVVVELNFVESQLCLNFNEKNFIIYLFFYTRNNKIKPYNCVNNWSF